ncbi:MAG: UPF0182 family protein [Candidatus Limnocylindrales bacterium]
MPGRRARLDQSARTLRRDPTDASAPATPTTQRPQRSRPPQRPRRSRPARCRQRRHPAAAPHPPDVARPRPRPRPRQGRRIGLWVIAAALLFLFVLFTSGLNLWTDALWYRSVGFDSVFWTRLGAQSALFLGAGVLALAVLLGNLALANRLAPAVGPADGRPGGTFRGLFERLNEAAQAADPDRARRGAGPWNQSPARPVSSVRTTSRI